MQNVDKNSNSGFVAGTLVHTDNGLIPIQNLQVGDLVLSKDSNNLNSEPVLKPIQLFTLHNEQEIFGMNYSLMAEPIEIGRYQFGFELDEQQAQDRGYIEKDFIMLGKNQKFFLTQVDYSSKTVLTSINYDTIGIGNDDFLARDMFNRLYQIEDYQYQEVKITAYPEKVYYELDGSNSEGLFIDIEEYKNGEFQFPSFDDLILGKPLFLTPNFDENGNFFDEKPYIEMTYSLKVQDFCSYFVGKKGLWVGDMPLKLA